jgi:2-succinyl-5-enolpyruvyl-6-hydroxy-3-cyclohexene-1-carboxylate synthase
VCGDLTFYHDLNGLLAARRHGVRALFVVLNNDGGGIFDHLPIAAHRDGYEEQFATPHGIDFRPVVEMYGCSFTRVTCPDDLTTAIARGLEAAVTTVVELRFARDASLAAWTALRAAAVRAAAEEVA